MGQGGGGDRESRSERKQGTFEAAWHPHRGVKMELPEPSLTPTFMVLESGQGSECQVQRLKRRRKDGAAWKSADTGGLVLWPERRCNSSYHSSYSPHNLFQSLRDYPARRQAISLCHLQLSPPERMFPREVNV